MKLDGLKAWKDLPMTAEGRAFSGTAVYETSLDWNEACGPAVLDLGRVDMIADVRVNGEKAGVLWATPYRIDISEWVKPGRT